MIKKILKNQFLSGSLIMILGTNLYNVGQFAFHFIAGRFLGKAFYGDLAAIISVLGLIGIIQLSVGLTIVKFISSHKNDQERDNFIKWIFHWNNLISLGLVVLILLLAPFISRFLNITQPISYMLAPIIFFFMISATGRSILQGLLQFGNYVKILLSEMFVKLILMVIFITSGFALFGTMVALLLGLVASAILAKIYLSKYLTGDRQKKPDIIPLLKYSSATFMQGLALTSMYSADLILVKHFFSAELAGLYASLSVLGRIVFFGISPIGQVMFPYISRKHSENKAYLNVLVISLGLALLASLAVTLVFFFMPNLAILLLFGSSYLDGAKPLWWFGLYMSLLALDMLFIQFYLSSGKTKIVSAFVGAALLQIALIWVNHKTILNVVQMSIISATCLLVVLVVYLPFHHRLKDI